MVTALRGCSLMVEPQPSKLMMGVRFSLPAPIMTGLLSSHLQLLAVSLMTAYFYILGGNRV